MDRRFRAGLNQRVHIDSFVIKETYFKIAIRKSGNTHKVLLVYSFVPKLKNEVNKNKLASLAKMLVLHICEAMSGQTFRLDLEWEDIAELFKPFQTKRDWNTIGAHQKYYSSEHHYNKRPIYDLNQDEKKRLYDIFLEYPYSGSKRKVRLPLTCLKTQKWIVPAIPGDFLPINDNPFEYSNGVITHPCQRVWEWQYSNNAIKKLKKQ